LKLIITIDTEEDNWGHYSPTGHTLDNVRRILSLQQLFDDYHVRPTYLLTYTVAEDASSVSILKSVFDKDKCDIGTHCHPWNTPPIDPLEAENRKRNSMLSNLPSELQFKKINCLHETIQKNFGMEPIGFRSGRWGYNHDTAKSLHRLGYKIDSSVLPYTDWSQEYGPDFTDLNPQPYRFSPENIFQESPNGPLLEIPASVGYLQQNFMWCNWLSKTLKREPVKRLRLIGILHRLRLLNKVWLSPEVSNSKDMIKLARRMIKNNYKVINMFFHSPSLKAGLTPFVKTKDDERRFLQQIREVLSFAQDEGIEPIKLSQAVEDVLYSEESSGALPSIYS